MYPTRTQFNDQELAWRVAAVLDGRRIQGANGIEVCAVAGVIVLRGQLASERDKALCLLYCKHVAGVMRVVDELRLTEKAPASRVRTKNRKARASREPICLPTT